MQMVYRSSELMRRPSMSNRQARMGGGLAWGEYRLVRENRGTSGVDMK